MPLREIFEHDVAAVGILFKNFTEWHGVLLVPQQFIRVGLYGINFFEFANTLTNIDCCGTTPGRRSGLFRAAYAVSRC